MKILFYIESLRSGGKERRLVELIKGLSKYPDIEMELVLTKEDIHYTDIFETGIKIHYTIRKGLKKDPRLFFKFYKIARKVKPDIIHVWGNMVAVYAIPAKVILGIPMINNQITNAPLKEPSGFLTHKLTFKFANRIISNSKAGLLAYNAPKNKSTYIYNGFDINRIYNLKKKEDVKRQFNIKSDYVIGMFASFSDSKDYDSYIKAAIKLCNNHLNITFLAVGDGDYQKYLDQIPETFLDRILFLGKQSNVESIMNVCDIGVLASFTEGISNALLELMALGKPIIASGGGGTKELIDDNNGFLIKSSNPTLLAEKIEILLNNKELAESMGKKSKVIVKKKFNVSLMINGFIKEYQKALKN